MDKKTLDMLVKYADVCKEYGLYSLAASNYLMNTPLTHEMERWVKTYRVLARVKAEHWKVGDIGNIEDLALYEEDTERVNEILKRLEL